MPSKTILVLAVLASSAAARVLHAQIPTSGTKRVVKTKTTSDVPMANPPIPADASKNALHTHLFGYDITEVADARTGFKPENKRFPPEPPTDLPKPDAAQRLKNADAATAAWAKNVAMESQLGYGPPYVQPAFTLAPGCALVNGSCPCQVTTYMGVTSCISNYNPSGYNNNERCTFIVNRDINIFSVDFDTEGYFDQLVVNGLAYSGSLPNGGSGPNGIQLTIGSNITWESDVSVSGTGFDVCVTPAFYVEGAADNTQCNVTLQAGTNAPCIQNLNYGNNEACTFAVTSTVVLNVVRFSTEAYFDNLYVNGVAYSGTTGPAGVRVAAGTQIYWKSDISVSSGGFLICTTPAFEVISSTPAPSSTGPCLVTSGVAGESCLYDRNYGNNEQCTAKVTLNEVQIDTVAFDTESGFDFLTVNGIKYSGSTGPNQVSVPDNAAITWSSDYSVTGGGWEICANLESPCSATCNSDGSVNLPAVQFSELLAGYGQPGNYQAPAPQLKNSCCGSSGGFCGTNKLFQDDQCRNALSILVNQLGYNGPALTCKFYSCTGAGNVSLPVFSRLAYVSASVCASYSSSLASLVCTPPLRTTPAPGTGFLCGADNSCVSVSSVPGAGPTEGVSLGVCRETCGAAAGTYACAGAQGCQLSSAGGSLYACQQTCTAAAEKPPFM